MKVKPERMSRHVALGEGDEVRAVRNRTTGTVLVAEYPPPPDARWTRLWRFGGEEPAGLVKASSLMDVALSGHGVQPTGRDSASRWLETFHGPVRIALAAWALAAALVLGGGAALVMREQQSAAWATAIELLLLSPVAALASGNLAVLVGLATITTNVGRS